MYTFGAASREMKVGRADNALFTPADPSVGVWGAGGRMCEYAAELIFAQFCRFQLRR